MTEKKLAAYKFKIGMEDVIETPVPGTEVDENGQPREPDRFRWNAVMCVVLAHDEAEARATAIASSPDGYDAPWINVVTPERIELDGPRGIMLMRL